MWLFFALLSALFAALTSILAKLGIDGVNSNLATAIRIVCSRSDGLGNGISYPCSKRNFFDWKKKLDFSHPVRPCHRRSWLCYYRALQLGDASKLFLWINSAL